MGTTAAVVRVMLATLLMTRTRASRPASSAEGTCGRIGGGRAWILRSGWEIVKGFGFTMVCLGQGVWGRGADS